MHINWKYLAHASPDVSSPDVRNFATVSPPALRRLIHSNDARHFLIGWVLFHRFRLDRQAADFDGIALPGSPADFGKFMVDETERSSKVIQAAHLKVG